MLKETTDKIACVYQMSISKSKIVCNMNYFSILNEGIKKLVTMFKNYLMYLESLSPKSFLGDFCY